MEYVNSAILNLKLLENIFPAFDFEYLKAELKLMRTFFLCARNWINNTNDVDASQRISLFGLKDVVGKMALNVPDPSFPDVEEKIKAMIIDVLKSIDSVAQQFNDIYSTLCDWSVQSSSSIRVEFMEYYDSLQENLVDLHSTLYWRDGFCQLTRDLGEKLTFLKNMICFVILRGIEQRQFEELLKYSRYVGVKTAWVLFLFFNTNDEKEMESKIFELL